MPKLESLDHIMTLCIFKFVNLSPPHDATQIRTNVKMAFMVIGQWFFVYFGVNNVGLIFDGFALQILQRLGLLKAVTIAVFDDTMYCRFTS